VTVDRSPGICRSPPPTARAAGFWIAERGIAQIPRAVAAAAQIGVGIDAQHARIGDDALIVPERICLDDPTTWLLVSTNPPER